MRVAFVALFAAALLASAPAVAAPPAEDATLVSARKIAQEGLDLFDSGKYQEALDRFEQADEMVHAPTMALMAARSLAKLGRLVEASARYQAVSRAALDASASEAFREAVVSAGKERAALVGRIPSLTISAQVAQGQEAVITLDGQVLPASALGEERPVDPGDHTVVGRLGEVTKTAHVTVAEGKSLPVSLDLRPRASAGSPLRTIGFIALGAGVAGLALGGVAGGLALSKKGELDAAGCRDNFCPLASASEVDGYNALRNVSGVGFITGAILAVGGVTLIAVSPSAASGNAGVRWAPVIGAGRVGLRGVF